MAAMVPSSRHAGRATSEHEVHELIESRFSTRAFAATPVERAKLVSILEAARWAPSSGNAQPWRFLVTRQGSEPFERLAGCLSHGNRRWAPRAPVLVLTAAKSVLEPKGDKPARDNPYALHDVGQATAFMTLQATALGLHVHQMGGFDKAAAAEAFGLPEHLSPVAVVAIGYLGDAETLPDDVRSKEEAARTRLSLRELVLFPSELEEL